MRIVEVVPRADNGPRMKALLNEKERELRERNRGTFRHKRGTWVHTRYGGQIALDQRSDGVLVATVRQRGREPEWQLLRAFVGFLERHFADRIASMTIHFPERRTVPRRATTRRTAKRRAATRRTAKRRAATRRTAPRRSRVTAPRRRAARRR